MPDLILQIVAAGCFLFAAVGAPSRINLVAAGLFFWVLSVIL